MCFDGNPYLLDDQRSRFSVDRGLPRDFTFRYRRLIINMGLAGDFYFKCRSFGLKFLSNHSKFHGSNDSPWSQVHGSNPSRQAHFVVFQVLCREY